MHAARAWQGSRLRLARPSTERGRAACSDCQRFSRQQPDFRDLGSKFPRPVLRRWLDGDFQLAVSEQLLARLRRAVACIGHRWRKSGITDRPKEPVHSSLVNHTAVCEDVLGEAFHALAEV